MKILKSFFFPLIIIVFVTGYACSQQKSCPSSYTNSADEAKQKSCSPNCAKTCCRSADE